MTETNAAIISAYVAALVAIGSLIGQFLVYRQKRDAEKNKPKVDDSQAELNEANAAETMGKAWDLLYAKLEKRVNEQEEIIRKQEETIRRQGETIRSLMNSMDKDRVEKEALTRENDELRRRISEQEKEITALREKVDKLERVRSG